MFLRSLLPLPRWQDKLHLPSGTKDLESGRITLGVKGEAVEKVLQE